MRYRQVQHFEAYVSSVQEASGDDRFTVLRNMFSVEGLSIGVFKDRLEFCAMHDLPDDYFESQPLSQDEEDMYYSQWQNVGSSYDDDY